MTSFYHAANPRIRPREAIVRGVLDWDPGFSEDELVDLVVSVASDERSQAAPDP
jgi:hypothetical protein